MRFAAIAVGIGINAACGRQAMPMADYVYAPAICSIKIPKNYLHLYQFSVNLHLMIARFHLVYLAIRLINY